MSEHTGFNKIRTHGFVRVAVAAPSVNVADPHANAAGILELAEQAHESGADLLLFPELCLTGYAIDDLLTQDALLDDVEIELGRIAEGSRSLHPLLLVGAPVRRNGRLYNVAVAIAGGTIIGVVPKSYLPNYREYYEKRWFASGMGLNGLAIELAGQTAPFGTDLIFAAADHADFTVHAEICEDLWSPAPPSIDGALAGAHILCNLSASNILIGKSESRSTLCAAQSMRCLAAYAYAAAGTGESSTDMAFDGQGSIHELGAELTATPRFARTPQLAFADIDMQRLRLERMRNGTFNDAASARAHPERLFRRIDFGAPAGPTVDQLARPLARFPFVPHDRDRLTQDCYEAFNIQVAGLARRLEATGAKKMVIGVSGGLDSTHALLVAARTCDLLGRPRSDIVGVTLPGFATSASTKANAWRLMEALGIDASEIDIRPAASRMLADIGHPAATGAPVYDITYENVQAGLRTDYLFRIANQRNGFVIGTGDLSELALGWSTYGVGDQMSHYGVNSGVPKTLIQYLIRWCAEASEVDAATADILRAILETEISPELVPPGADGAIQSTEDRIGPYALHDFFLYHVLREALPPSKIAFLAWQAWRDPAQGLWPAGFPEDRKTSYDLPTIVKWLEIFVRRFFATSQYKRSALPNGPKVSPGGGLSPRADWRAPSDASAEAWLRDLAKVPR